MVLLHHGRWIDRRGIAATIIGLAIAFLGGMIGGCSHAVEPSASTPAPERVRVRLMQDVDRVQLTASANPHVSLESDPHERILGFPSGTAIPVTLDSTGWHIGSLAMPTGTLIIKPGTEGSVRIATSGGSNNAHRGYYKFVPIGAGHFDVINDVDIDGYLKGVLNKEMLSSWDIEAFKAQAITARTYAMYEAHTAGLKRYWDVYPDQRSQVYGGVDAETSKSQEAVDQTAGIVLTFGPGEGKIFKAYFSSCCGGVTQAGADAFPGEAYIEPLSEQFRGPACNGSKFFNWGPIIIRKDELTRRVRLWGERRARIDGHPRPEASMAPISRMAVGALNRYNRPTRFIITDAKGVQFNLASEEMRAAANTDANGGATLPSSFCNVSTELNADAVTFFDGHGNGHGVGLCQYTAEAQAAAGEHHEQILAQAFPQSRLARAY